MASGMIRDPELQEEITRSAQEQMTKSAAHEQLKQVPPEYLAMVEDKDIKEILAGEQAKGIAKAAMGEKVRFLRDEALAKAFTQLEEKLLAFSTTIMDGLPADGIVKKSAFIKLMNKALPELYEIVFFLPRMGVETAAKESPDLKAEDMELGITTFKKQLEKHNDRICEGIFKVVAMGSADGTAQVDVIKATIGQLHGKWKVADRIDVLFKAFGDGEKLDPKKFLALLDASVSGGVDIAHAVMSTGIEFAVLDAAEPMIEWGVKNVAADGKNIEVSELAAAVAVVTDGHAPTEGLVGEEEVKKMREKLEKLAKEIFRDPEMGYAFGALPILAPHWK